MILLPEFALLNLFTLAYKFQVYVDVSFVQILGAIHGGQEKNLTFVLDIMFIALYKL